MKQYFGGSSYKWAGKNIRMTDKDGKRCVCLPRNDSILIIPISVQANKEYKVTFNASNASGSGAIICNFFASLNFDGSHVGTNVKYSSFNEINIKVTAPQFPQNLPMYLRVFRPNNASGNVFINFITVEDHVQEVEYDQTIKYVESNKIEKYTEEVLKKEISKKEALVEIEKQSQIINRNKEQIKREQEDMHFRPYKNLNTTDLIKQVFVDSKEKVPKISIITPTYNGRDLIEKCYKALIKNTGYPNWEWVVGDNGSTDGTVEYLKSLEDARIKIIDRGNNDGSFSSVNNELVKYSDGEYVVFLNNDTEPQSLWLYEMVSKITNNPNIGAVGSRLMYNEKDVQHCGIVFIPQGPANIGHHVLADFWPGFEKSDRYFQAVTAACMLMRRKDFDALGGFDEDYYYCYDDVDLCLRIGSILNKKILYSANSVVIHSESITQKKNPRYGDKFTASVNKFKEKWLSKVDIDYTKYKRDINYNVYPVDISFVTCINNTDQYLTHVVGSLFKNVTKMNYEIIPVLNNNNTYSASAALNMGIDRARSNVVVLCHQDIIFYQNWIDILFKRIDEIKDPNWGILGTAGITDREQTCGVVHTLIGGFDWQSNIREIFMPVQTVDEHCIILRKNSGLRFDEKNLNAFHFYGVDICLQALNRGMKNYGILNPLVHNSSGGSLKTGKKDYIRMLDVINSKWSKRFPVIRTPTCLIKNGVPQIFVKL